MRRAGKGRGGRNLDEEIIGSSGPNRKADPVSRLTRLYLRSLIALVVLAPSAGIVYIHFLQAPDLKWVQHDFHVVAVTGSILLGLFVTGVSFLCYRETGEPFLRWLTLGFLGFVILYFPHGALTHTADGNIWLFILYGPFSRLAIGAFLIAALLAYGRAEDPPPMRTAAKTWFPWIVLLIATVGAVFALADSPVGGHPMVRWISEGGQIALCLIGIVIILVRRDRPVALVYLAVALAMYAQSGVAFLLAKPWNHMWWYAHVIFAAGFFVLSYILMRAFQTTHSLVAVYTLEEMVSRVAAARTETAGARRSAQQLRQMLDLSPIGVAIGSEEGRILYVNPAMEAIVEVEGGDLLGHRPEEIFRGSCLRESLIAEARREGAVRGREVECRTVTGQKKWVLASLTPIDYEGKPAVVAWNLDITLRRQSETALRRAKEAAEESSRAKSEFLAAMSHELRTPLNAVIGFSDAIREETFGPIGNETYREYLDNIHSSGNHLLDIINDILDVSSIEAGAMTLHEEDVDLGKAVDATIRLVRPRADRKRLTLVSSIEPGLAVVQADERRIKQVALNLLGNAIKFTPEGGEITVACRMEDDGSMSLSVADTGIGMTPEETALALQTFRQVDSGLDRKEEGTGLGLPLTKGLMELHGGRLEIRSEKGRGTTVAAIFPKGRVVRGTS